jgi:sugar lactone lactonase YvrE
MHPIAPYSLSSIKHIWDVDHPESISIGPDGEAFTTGTGGQIYRINLIDDTAQMFASTAPRRVLGQAVDANGNLYCAEATSGKVIRITPAGEESVYGLPSGGGSFLCANYPAFDSEGNLYLSDSGDFSDAVNGRLYKIPRGGGEAILWYPDPVDTPNAIALDAGQQWLYFIETWGSSISRVEIRSDGSSGRFERILHIPSQYPDGFAFDDEGRIWIAFHRPDAIRIFDPHTRRLETFAEDPRARDLRAPTDVAFAGPGRDVLLAASLGNLCVHRFDGAGARGLKLHFPRL